MTSKPPMTLGEFRRITADLPDDAPLMHVHEDGYNPTTSAVIAHRLVWWNADYEVLPIGTGVITGGEYDNAESWAEGVEK